MPATALETALSRSSEQDAVREITGQIRAGGVKHVYLQYVSIQGRVLAKLVPAKHFERFCESGLAWTFLAAGGFAETREGATIGPSAIEVAEGVLVPDLATFRILPWDREIARVFCDHYHRADEPERPGAPVDCDCRLNLKRELDRFGADFGLEVRSGCEPEMSWYPDPADPRPGPLRTPDNVGPTYNVAVIEELRPVIKRVTEYGEAMGLDMIQADFEHAGQVEMNFGPEPALRTADNLVTYRQICVQVAKEFGILATFMPKPTPGIMANGCHHHISLWDGERPVFAGEGPEGLSDLGRQAIAGVLAHARGMTALVAPTVNSYARYWEVGLFAPTTPTWGLQNRQCMVRVLDSRFEYRGPDASCNPYISHAAILAAVRDGLERGLDPGPQLPPETEATADLESPFESVPMTLADALAALQQDPVVCSSLTPDLLAVFLELKYDEWHRACGAVTDWDRETYLNYVP
ncbi:MAG: glutamine synthetase family protein [Solirubrobacterales bacterium]